MIFLNTFAIYFILLSDVSLKTYAQLYTSTAELEYVLDSREKLIEDLNSYIEKEEERLSAVNRYLHLYKSEHRKAMTDIPNYVGSPLSVFVLIKSLTIDLQHVKEKILIGTEIINNVTIKRTSYTYPTLKDLEGAAQGLSRLKKMYNLDVRDLVEGKLNGVGVSAPLSTSDCYELGRVLYNSTEYEIGRAFMEEAYRKNNQEHISYPFTDINILEQIGFGSYLLRDFTYGITITERILQINPNNEKAIFSRSFFQKEIQNSLTDTHRLKKGTKIVSKNEDHENFVELCNDMMDVPLEVSSRLTCSYLTDRHPFLKIAPIKMEMKYLNPDLILFHDVLSDNEIELVKRLAKPRFQRAGVIDTKTGIKIVMKNSPIAKRAAVYDKDSDIILRISRRITQATGLSVDNTMNRIMSVINYGIGGIYEPHLDSINVYSDTYTVEGGRNVATILFYLSDVTQGGATVFTKLGVRVTPVKGTALFWHNLHLSGETNTAMMHGACPVLQGSKWVLTRFIKEAGQEFRIPCSLEYQKEGIGGFIPPPVLKKTRDPK